MEEKNNYYGVFDCYSPGRSRRTLVMSGIFNVEDLHLVSVDVDQEVKQFREKQQKVYDKALYYGRE